MSTYRESKPNNLLPFIRQRANALAQARDFFASRNIIEVVTPAIQRHATTDAHIESFAVSNPNNNQYCGFLHTSPEWMMKALIANGIGDCYQIASVFRYGEQGQWHHPTFLLLEWYRLDWTASQLLQEVLSLLATLGIVDDVISLSFVDICKRAGLDNPQDINSTDLTAVLSKANICWQGNLTTRELFDLFWQTCVQSLLNTMPIVVIDHFPADNAVFAALDEDGFADRFEIYFRGIELANGGLESRDVMQMRDRMVADCAYRTAQERFVPTIDEEYLDAIAQLPPVSGVAVGFDRVAALAAGAKSLDGFSRPLLEKFAPLMR